MGFLSSLNEARKDATSSIGAIFEDSWDDISTIAKRSVRHTKGMASGAFRSGRKLTKIIEDAGEDVYEAGKHVGSFVIDDIKFTLEKSGDIAGKVLEGKLSEAGDEITESFGEHQRMMTDNLVDLGFSENNWIVQNSDAVATAIAAGVIASSTIGAAGTSGASASEIAQAQVLADTIGSGTATGLGSASYGLGELTAEQVGSYLATQGASSWFDTAKEWAGNINKVKNIYDVFNPPQMPQQQQGTAPLIGTGRNANYNNMLDRLKTEIDPYQEMTNPAGARY